MSDKIKFIANNPIEINNLTNDLQNVLNKINAWIKLIEEYGTICEDNTLFESYDLDNRDFTYEMRIASLGTEYKNWAILPVTFHRMGETWIYEKLILTSNTGMVEWYCNKLNLTNDEYIKVSNNESIKILGAFYHRMKIIIENIEKIFKFFSGNKIFNLFEINHVDKFLSKPNNKLKNLEIYNSCIQIKKYQYCQEELTLKYLNIEKATDLAQLALFNYIKNKSFL